MARSRKPILCVDFDGVIHSYSSGWQGPCNIPDPPVPGAFQWLSRAMEYWEVHIYSSRSKEIGAIDAMQRWFWYNAGTQMPDERQRLDFIEKLHFSAQKPAANMTIDDRAVCFNGNWDDPNLDPKKLLEFQPWNKRKPDQRKLPSHIQHLIDAIDDSQKDLKIHLEASILKELYGPVTK